ncbi:MAG: hypothetical protein QOJ00_2791 [Actinomycetota bacterium]|jgi:hypothetical protein
MSAEAVPSVPYVPAQPRTHASSDELRARIPGWGVDLDPKDRPSYPREQEPAGHTGAHWEFPERQVEKWPRERSIEHGTLPPVFGTSCPPRGLSGVIRKFAYRRYSEARAAHWLLLVGADRVDAVEHHLRSFASLRPDNPVTQTGIKAEFGRHGMKSRFGQKRADVAHHAIDPLIVVGPWVAGGWLAFRGVRRVTATLRHR